MCSGVTGRFSCGCATTPDACNQVQQGRSLLVVGPSGAGKTSTLRAVAGLWTAGRGSIRRSGRAVAAGSGGGDVFFLPQVSAVTSRHSLRKLGDALCDLAPTDTLDPLV